MHHAAQIISGSTNFGGAMIHACAALLLFTSFVHSFVGEKRLIAPLLAQRNGVMAHPLARVVLRLVWHFMTILFCIIAATLWASLESPKAATTTLLIGTAAGIGGAGVIDAIASRGKHIGWPMLVLIGVTAALALKQNG